MGKFKHVENLLRDSMAMCDVANFVRDAAVILERPEWNELYSSLARMQIPDVARLKEVLEAVTAVADQELRGGSNDWMLHNFRLIIQHAESSP